MTTRNLLSRISRVDWDFAGKYSDSPFSAIHFHPCRFASQLPATLIGLLSEPGDLVMDPFVGSGTTLVEAQRLGRRSVGVDLSPIAILSCMAKTISKSADVVSDTIQCVRYEADSQLSKQLKLMRSRIKPIVPASVQATKW